jgi:flagellar FliL protein
MSEESPSIKNNSEKGRGTLAKGLAAGVVVFALLAGAFWILVVKRQAVGGQSPAASAPAVKEVVHLEGFVVNLADPPGDCFLRIGIDLGLARSIKGRGEKDEGAIPTAKIRDVVLRVLTTYHSNDLLDPVGKVKLKQQLLESLQAAIPELEVREVYFTDFLVQR